MRHWLASSWTPIADGIPANDEIGESEWQRTEWMGMFCKELGSVTVADEN